MRAPFVIVIQCCRSCRRWHLFQAAGDVDDVVHTNSETRVRSVLFRVNLYGSAIRSVAMRERACQMECTRVYIVFYVRGVYVFFVCVCDVGVMSRWYFTVRVTTKFCREAGE